jgi:hypothetical protein
VAKKMTSKMKAVIDPGRFGITVIDIYYGLHRPRKNQNLLLAGDLIRDAKGKIHRFAYQKDDAIFAEPV